MAHTHTKLLYHLIFSTKLRRAQIKPAFREPLFTYMGGIIKRSGGHLLRIGGTADHVHLLVELGPTTPIADLMRLIKTNSSKWIHETYPLAAGFAWQTGYAAFSVSSSAADDVARYIDGQDQHHRTHTFETEFVEFLRRHRIEYDRRFVLD